MALDRELKIALVFAGGSADLAYIHNHAYSIIDYEVALVTDEYKSFAKRIQDEFLLNADQRLLGNLYRAEQALQEIGPKEKNYPQILKAYTDLLKLTAPIVERISTKLAESTVFQGLRLVIDGAEDKEG